MDYAGKEVWQKSEALEVVLASVQDAEKKQSTQQQTESGCEIEAPEQTDVNQVKGADVTDDMADSERGRFLDSGWLVLRHER